MAAGRPVICLDLGGPAVRVTNATGIKVAAIDPEQVVTDLTAALLRLQADPIHRAQLAQAGRLRVDQEFNWDRTGEKLARMYQGLLGDEKSVIQSDRIEDAVVATQER
jgi:glycosyltransferase involved in cell wall biosynthesis